MLILECLIFAFVWWLGLYLVYRDLRNIQLRLTGAGLLVYGFTWTLHIFNSYAPPLDLWSAQLLVRAERTFQFLPAVCWIGAMLHFLPYTTPTPRIGLLNKLWLVGLLPLTLIFVVLGLFSDLFLSFAGNDVQIGPGYILFAVVTVTILLTMTWLVWHEADSFTPQRVKGVLALVTLFFGIGTFSLLIPFGWVSQFWLLLLVGIDLALLGIAVASLNAFEEGETLLSDFILSLETSAFYALIFGVQVGLVTYFAIGINFAMVLTLLLTIATAIILQVTERYIRGFFDNLVFGKISGVKAERAELRATEAALPRTNQNARPETLPEPDFTRLTRRAISHFGDLSHLAANPLIYLPQVENRLKARGARDDQLERATELKAILIECIELLKPRSQSDFDTTGEWRFYNALYFPYVAGLKPYSQKDIPKKNLPLSSQQALEWFRNQVPERTLYNWQNTAAKLVAQELKAQMQTATKQI